MMHDRATAESLGLLRLVVFGTWFVVLLLDPVAQLHALPRAVFDPAGVVAMLPGGFHRVLLTETALQALRLGSLLLALVVAVGIVRVRAAAVACVVALVVHQSILMGFSRGVEHHLLPLLYTAGILALLPIFDGLSLRPADAATRAAHVGLYRLGFLLPGAVLVATYVFVPVARLVNHGLGSFTGPTLQNVAVGIWMEPHALSSTAVLPEPPWLLRVLPEGAWGLLFALGTLLELTTALVMVSRPARLVVVPGLVLFHVATAALLGIDFYEQVVLLLVLFSPVWFHRLAEAVGPRWPRLARE